MGRRSVPGPLGGARASKTSAVSRRIRRAAAGRGSGVRAPPAAAGRSGDHGRRGGSYGRGMTNEPSKAGQTNKIGSLEVSVAGIGCNNFGMRIDEERSRAVVDAALDAGVTLFDTADLYGGGEVRGVPRPRARVAARPGRADDQVRDEAAARRSRAGQPRVGGARDGREPRSASASTMSTSSCCTSPTRRRRSATRSRP